MTRRPENRNYLADTDPTFGIQSQEKFDTHIYLNGPNITRPLRTGICYQWPVPASASAHYAWIASGAYVQTSNDPTTQWFVQGKLNFIRNGKQIGDFFFCDVSSNFGSVLQKQAERPLIRSRGDASGSYQPVLRFQQVDAASLGTTYARDNLDMGCFILPIRCDRIDYEIQSFTVTPAVGDVHILTGARIVSLP